VGAAEKLELLTLLEEKRRRVARDDLNAYCSYIEIPGAPINDDDPDCEEFYADTVTPAAHHRLINGSLMKVESGEIRRLMVFMPPGSAKSTYGTIAFPTWFIGKKPGRHAISTSYGSDLATRFGRKCRQITRSDKYRELFDAELNADNRAANDWSLSNASTYMSAGILGGLTGNRADLIVIDDPIKGRDAADSPTIRDKVWEEYKASIRTRLKPGGSIVIIQTRWHEDDLSGRILPATWKGESGWVTAKDGEKWFVICLPAQCEHADDPLGRKVGDWLWTDWFTPEHWAQERIVQGERNWSALYQQRPTPSEGGIFKRIWPQRYVAAPSEFQLVVQTVDSANKPGELNDYSVVHTYGITKQGYYHLDTWREKVDYPTLKHSVKNLAAKWNPNVLLIEDKASGQQLIQELRSTTRLPIVSIEPEGDKIIRAFGVSSIVESGMLFLPESAPWLIDFESEFFAFPLSTYKDQVDALTQFLKWVHPRMVQLEAWGAGKLLEGYALGGRGSQLDTERGYGTVRSDTNLDGF
jgi:predicted phage terminase large subunit-like protein